MTELDPLLQFLAKWVPSFSKWMLCLLPASRWFLVWFIFWSWRWRRHVSPKRRVTFSGVHGVISQKTELFMTIAVTISGRTCNNFLAFVDSQVPVFISPRTRVSRLYPEALGSLFVASSDSQGYDGGIRPRLHAGTLESESESDFTTGGLPPMSSSWRQVPWDSRHNNLIFQLWAGPNISHYHQQFLHHFAFIRCCGNVPSEPLYSSGLFQLLGIMSQYLTGRYENQLWLSRRDHSCFVFGRYHMRILAGLPPIVTYSRSFWAFPSERRPQIYVKNYIRLL
jgi:hypothetical protein